MNYKAFCSVFIGCCEYVIATHSITPRKIWIRRSRRNAGIPCQDRQRDIRKYYHGQKPSYPYVRLSWAHLSHSFFHLSAACALRLLTSSCARSSTKAIISDKLGDWAKKVFTLSLSFTGTLAHSLYGCGWLWCLSALVGCQASHTLLIYCL